MRTTILIRVLALAALAFAAIGASPATAEERAKAGLPAYGFDRIEGATLAGLQLAYEAEMNARWRYLVYENIAWREGHPRAATLFRAIAHAESIHAENHRRQVERLGARATWEFASFAVGPTAFNLERSIGIERAESTTVYRAYGEYARLECDYDALASFDYARGAEGTHARMFARELAELRDGAGRPTLLASLVPVVIAEPPAPTGPVALVCRGCGSAFHVRPGRSCPNCGAACGTMMVFLAPR